MRPYWTLGRAGPYGTVVSAAGVPGGAGLPGTGNRTYLLAPANYPQAQGPNWYRGTYRRSGMYKGMGEAMPPGCDPNDLLCLAFYVPPSPGGAPAGAAPAQQQSYLPWIFGGALVLIALAARR